MDTQADLKISPAERRIVILVHSAIAGASIAATLELASRETWGPLLLLALGCFAVAIPCAIAVVILFQVIYELGRTPGSEASSKGQSGPPWSYILAVADQISCYIGFLALFCHFSWIIGLIFLSGTAIAFMTVWMAEKNLRRMREMNVAEKTT
jgi:hypothetical protein